MPQTEAASTANHAVITSSCTAETTSKATTAGLAQEYMVPVSLMRSIAPAKMVNDIMAHAPWIACIIGLLAVVAATVILFLNKIRANVS